MRFWTVPNAFTVMRIGMIPIFVICFYLPFEYHRYVAAFLFLLAAITDWLDGYLARSLHQVSPFGAFLDPVADKLMVASALLLIVAEYSAIWMTVAGMIIVSREIAVSALREWMAEMGKRATVKVSVIGKFKTFVQMAALLVLLSQPPTYSILVVLGWIALFISVILTLWSMSYYLHAAWREVKNVA